MYIYICISDVEFDICKTDEARERAGIGQLHLALVDCGPRGEAGPQFETHQTGLARSCQPTQYPANRRLMLTADALSWQPKPDLGNRYLILATDAIS